MAPGSAYCAQHKGSPNIVLPSIPVSIAVRQGTHQGAAASGGSAPSATGTPVLRPLPGQPPQHRRTGAHSLLPSASDTALEGQAKNMQRMKFAHATQLAKRVTDPEYMAPLLKAFGTLTQTPGFAKCLDAEVGWTNWSAWFDWAIRAMAPEMAMRPVAVEVRDLLRSKSLLAGTRNEVFADRYFFELSLYCDAAIERMDTSFILGQASMIFGPILAPILAVPAAAAKAAGGVAAGYAAQAGMGIGKGLAEMGIKAGTKELVTTTPGQKIGATKKYENLNPMRFTLAWLAYVTSNAEPRKEVEAIVKEFGGAKGVRNLYSFLKSSNL